MCPLAPRCQVRPAGSRLAWRLSELELEVACVPELREWVGFIDLLQLLPS